MCKRIRNLSHHLAPHGGSIPGLVWMPALIQRAFPVLTERGISFPLLNSRLSWAQLKSHTSSGSIIPCLGAAGSPPNFLQATNHFVTIQLEFGGEHLEKCFTNLNDARIPCQNNLDPWSGSRVSVLTHKALDCFDPCLGRAGCFQAVPLIPSPLITHYPRIWSE